MSDDLTRYMTPQGGGITRHRAGLLYHRHEVDPLINALRAEIDRLKSEMAFTETQLEAAQEMMPAKPGLLRKRMAERAAAKGGGVSAIATERQRQIEQEGWTPKHDDQHTLGELRIAAACYAGDTRRYNNASPAGWPWEEEWWKPKDRRTDLVRAGALIAAEIDRLDRAARQNKDAE